MPEPPSRSDVRRARTGLAEWLAVTIADTADDEFAPVTLWRLSPVSTRPSLGRYLRQLWQRRHFILADARAKSFQTTRGTLLGRAWLLLNPFFNAFIYLIVFGFVLQVSRGIENFVGYVVIGVSFFSFLQKALNSGGAIIPNSVNLMRSFSFPRAALVISWSIRSLLDFLPVVVATMAFIALMPPNAGPAWTWALFPLVLLLGWLFTMGLAFFTASLTARAPDLKFIWPLIGRFWFYTSGVFFSIDRYDSHPAIHSVMEANPGYHFLKMSRDTLIYSTAPAPSDWLHMAIWAVGFVVVGFVFFWRHEESYGREH